jgi:hypothetical protein
MQFSILFEINAARKMLGLSMDAKIRVEPSNLEKYLVFVQNTSVNRNWLAKLDFYMKSKTAIAKQFLSYTLP